MPPGFTFTAPAMASNHNFRTPSTASPPAPSPAPTAHRSPRSPSPPPCRTFEFFPGGCSWSSSSSKLEPGEQLEQADVDESDAQVEDDRAEVAGTPADPRRRPKSGGRSVGESELRMSDMQLQQRSSTATAMATVAAARRRRRRPVTAEQPRGAANRPLHLTRTHNLARAPYLLSLSQQVNILRASNDEPLHDPIMALGRMISSRRPPLRRKRGLRHGWRAGLLAWATTGPSALGRRAGLRPGDDIIHLTLIL